MSIAFRKIGGRIVPILKRAGRPDLPMSHWPHRKVAALKEQVGIVKRVRELAKSNPNMKAHKTAAKIYGLNVDSGIKSYLKKYGGK